MIFRILLVATVISTGWFAGPARAQTFPSSPFPVPTPLRLEDVVTSILSQYPPLLAAQIEQDVANGRLRSAQGIFDFNAFSKVFGAPAGYYQYGTADVGFEQFTGIWGSTVFGGYRYTGGDQLPQYYNNRTEGDGEVRFGLDFPILKDGSIDKRRAALFKARLDQKLAQPVIDRQRIDFVRAGSMAYFNWAANGQKLTISSNLLRLALNRNVALTNQFEAGLLPKIVLTDNQRLVVSRELSLVQARRRFEAASLTLSLFYRDGNGAPIVAPIDSVPSGFPTPPELDEAQVGIASHRAMDLRPELRRLQINRQKLEVDVRLARNQMLPNLNAGAMVMNDFGKQIYKDLVDPQVKAGLEFKIPLQRREARGRLDELEGQLGQLTNDQRFAQDRIRNEIWDAFSAYRAAFDQTRQTQLNVTLAQELLSAEASRFDLGISDLLALQIREQAAFDARTLDVDAAADVFRALADYRAATASDLSGAVRSPAAKSP
jgi:outer membrane protein TolC